MQADPQPFRLSEAVTASLFEAKKRALGESPAIPTGFRDLDYALGGGLEPCSLLTLAARPRMGKTALALTIGQNVAAAGHPVLFFSLEVERAQLGRRALAAKSRVGYRTLRRPRGLAELEAHKPQLRAAANALRPLDFWAIDQRVDVATVCRIAGHWIREDGRAPLVIVDYLQRLKEAPDRRKDSRERNVAEQCVSLKEFANQRKCAVLLGAQLNREVEHRQGNRPKLSDLRESGAIEQESDVVALLHRPALYDSKADPQLLEIHLPKQREAESGTACRLRYDTETQHFGDWAEPGQRKLTPVEGGRE